jgi:hypothetical protein
MFIVIYVTYGFFPIIHCFGTLDIAIDAAIKLSNKDKSLYNKLKIHFQQYQSLSLNESEYIIIRTEELNKKIKDTHLFRTIDEMNPNIYLDCDSSPIQMSFSSDDEFNNYFN